MGEELTAAADSASAAASGDELPAPSLGERISELHIAVVAIPVLKAVEGLDAELQLTDVSVYAEAHREVVHDHHRQRHVAVARAVQAVVLSVQPVLDVQEARTVFVVKRGMSAGYSGIKNDLFELANTSMVFGDAKKVLGDLLVELKDLGLGKK